MESRTIVVTGPVGAGKSTIAAALSDELERHDVPHGMIDVDYVRWCTPAPADDPFHSQLGLRNVAAVAANYRAVGAKIIILADVVEHDDKRQDYTTAIPDSRLTVVRLRVPMDLVKSRLRHRESAESLAWYLARAPELEAIMDREGIGDLVVDVGERSPQQVATEIVEALRLLPGDGNE